MTSHWLKKPDDWKTQGPKTTTVDNTQTTTTTDAYSVKVSTVSNPGQAIGIAQGDLYIELPPEVRQVFQNAASQACARKRSLEERQSCGISSAADFGNNLLDLVDNGEAEILEGPFEQVPEINIDVVEDAVRAIQWTGRRITRAIGRDIVAIGAVFFALWLSSGKVNWYIERH